MRKIMRGFSLGIECIVKGLMWIHRKSGINGILVIAILIALPCSIFFSESSSTQYKSGKRYAVTPVSDTEKVAEKDLPASIDRFADDYYKVVLQINNCYSTELPHAPYLTLNNEKYYASFRPLEYYCDIENSYDVISLENCIPAGTTMSIPYYFSGYELSGHTLSVMPLSDDEITKSNSFKLTVP
jgi:hypothetical protein